MAGEIAGWSGYRLLEADWLRGEHLIRHMDLWAELYPVETGRSGSGVRVAPVAVGGVGRFERQGVREGVGMSLLV